MLIQLPGNPLTFIDPTTVACVRATPDGQVAVHTTEGFAIGLIPDETSSVHELTVAVHTAIRDAAGTAS